MYDIRLLKNMTLVHRRAIQNRIMSENNPSKAKRMRNLFKGWSAKKLAETPRIDLKLIQDLTQKHNLHPQDKLQIIHKNGEEKDLNMTITVKDLIPKLTRPWL